MFSGQRILSLATGGFTYDICGDTVGQSAFDRILLFSRGNTLTPAKPPTI